MPDCESEVYWERMDRLIDLNSQLLAISASDAPALLKKLQQAPIIERMVANIWQIFVMTPMEVGSVDVNEPAMAY